MLTLIIIDLILLLLSEFIYKIFLSARNAIVVILAATLAAVLLHYGIDAFSLTEKVEPGLPKFAVPSFTVQDGNTTYTAEDIFSVSY